MYYIRRYSISFSPTTYISDVLQEKYDLKCQVSQLWDGSYSTIVDIPENHPNLDEIEALISVAKPREVEGELRGGVSVLYYPHYLEEDYRNCDRIRIMSSFMKVCAVNPDKVWRGECLFGHTKRRYPVYTHETYGDPFIVRSPVKWRQKYFASTDMDQGILFCSEEARRILTENNITGIIYDPVIRKSTGQPMEDIYRLRSSYTIPNDALVPTNDMIEGFCPKCGMRLLGKTSEKCRYGVIKDAIDPDVDFCETMSMMVGRVDRDHLFYDAGISYLISQKMYRVLKENKMDRALMFTPLETVDPKTQL